MKIIHTADIHLGSAMDSRFSPSFADERKSELRATFLRMVEFAAKEGVKAIILAGDVFDSDRPFKKDRDFFYSVVSRNPNIDFLYLRGNHDLSESSETFENLKTFSDSWTAYTYGDVNIVGSEISAENGSSIYSTLSLPEDKTNIVVLHGQTGDDVNLAKLRNKNIDYLALGHIHKPQGGKIDDRGVYAYSGCLEGRGFDEPGEHGFILLDVSEKVKVEFVPFASRKIVEEDVDVSEIDDSYAAYRKVKADVDFNGRDIYRINLRGETSERFADDVEKLLSGDCKFVSVKDFTVRKIDPEEYENDTSLRGEFVRTVLSRTDITEDEKREIINCGLRALSGKEIDL